MIVNNKSINIIYRCPECGQNVRGVLGFFSFSGDMLKLKCPCGGSTLTLTKSKDAKIRIEAPCLLCPNPHIFTVSEKLFFSGELLTLGCTYTAINICFIGETDNIDDAVRESDEEFNRLLEESGVDDFSALHPEEDDRIDGDKLHEIYEIESILNFMLLELSEEGGISCRCKKGSYRFEFVAPEYDSVRIYCESCGASLVIPMRSQRDAEEFIKRDTLTLK